MLHRCMCMCIGSASVLMCNCASACVRACDDAHTYGVLVRTYWLSVANGKSAGTRSARD